MFNTIAIKTIFFNMCTGILGALLIVWLLHQPARVKSDIATVDLNSIIQHFIQTQAKQKLAPQTMKNNSQQFSKQLVVTLHKLAIKNHLVLMPTQAVIAGTSDVTPQVRLALKKTVPQFFK